MNKLIHYLRSALALWATRRNDRPLANATDCADLERRMHELERIDIRFLP